MQLGHTKPAEHSSAFRSELKDISSALLNISVADDYIVSLFVKALLEVFGHSHRAVTPACAADGHNKRGLALGNIQGDKLVQQVEYLVRKAPGRLFGKDKIIKDTEQLYLDKIMFKGEFLRVKNGKEGYESKAYLQYYKNGKMINEKQIRFDRYEPQCGVVYEGVEDLIEGFTLPNQQEVS